jgi:ribosomal protein L16 Arg81 hydroxylase
MSMEKVDQAIGRLGAALAQVCAKDDQIIVDAMREAHAMLREFKASLPKHRTFDEAFSEHRLTDSERVQLVDYLANYRAQKTREALIPALTALRSTGSRQ